jgi:fused signal recognition particle receptor
MSTTLLIVLLAVALAVGIGAIILNRRRSTPPVATGRPAATTAAPKPKPAPTTPVVAPPATDDEPADESDASDAEPAELVDEPAAEPELEVERASFRTRMAKARGAFTGAFLGIRGRGGITTDTWDDLEESLLRADVGVRVTDELLDGLKARVKSKEITDPDGLLAALQADMRGRLEGTARALTFEPGEPGSPNVWLFVGVNGVGKTTTIGKVSAQQKAEGRSVLMAAGDTFRAAAAEQLTTWAERSDAEIVRGNEGGDPSAVIFDAIERASARDIDLVLADTAGRLHTKTNLMDELRKVRRVAAKGNGRVTEVLLVIDATTGQNGLTQAREFGDATEVTGVVLTKLDGSAKGGIVFAIETELGLPVKLVGLGETIGDLVPFEPAEFIDALFQEN